MDTITQQARVFQLSCELEDTRRRKRQVSSAFNDEIKRLQAEIRDLTHPEEAVDVAAEDLV